jgi:hypothetical protein
MSEDEGNVRVTAGEPGDGGAEDLAAEPDAGTDCHVISLRGPDGWQLDHPAQCPEPAGCAIGEAAGRISRAMCATLGRWTCDVAGGGLVLLERLGD